MKTAPSINVRDRRRHLVWFAQVFVVLMLIWLLLNGLNGLWTGLFAALVGAGAGSYFAAGPPYPWRPLRWLVFAGFFLWESMLGGVDVAGRALHPALKISPCFRRHKVQLAPGLPTTLLTSFISLLPGTLSTRLDEDSRELLIHALSPKSMASVERLERMLAWIFSEPAR